ncbi:hypothetical protein BpHYR1_014532 [Brachionus plicatilis]|uniref:Uncharacterized protein n=1 Tax=Brachionus plicatilis TaxID=10195 RepID=A0A3M7PZL9_BRAPC|nr:hypothetical protein BpHYR1_014532 [Brachionus plicatilis]
MQRVNLFSGKLSDKKTIYIHTRNLKKKKNTKKNNVTAERFSIDLLKEKFSPKNVITECILGVNGTGVVSVVLTEVVRIVVILQLKVGLMKSIFHTLIVLSEDPLMTFPFIN